MSVKKKELPALIEQASEMLVMLEPDDATSVAELRTVFVRMAEQSDARSLPSCAAAARGGVVLLNNLGAKKEAQPAAALDVLNQTIDALQLIIRDGRPPAEVRFPEALPDASQMADTSPATLPTAVSQKKQGEEKVPMTTPSPTAENKSTTLFSMGGKYLTFKLAGEEYGLEILKVQEIIKMMDITRVPRTPDFVRGVINLRGKVIPVVDLRLKFGMETMATTEKTCIIVVQVARADGKITMGIIVDEVSEVLDINGQEIEATPSFGTNVDTRFILGMAKTKGAVKILLDIDKVLSGEEVAMMSSL